MRIALVLSPVLAGLGCAKSTPPATPAAAESATATTEDGADPKDEPAETDDRVMWTLSIASEKGFCGLQLYNDHYSWRCNSLEWLPATAEPDPDFVDARRSIDWNQLASANAGPHDEAKPHTTYTYSVPGGDSLEFTVNDDARSAILQELQLAFDKEVASQQAATP